MTLRTQPAAADRTPAPIPASPQPEQHPAKGGRRAVLAGILGFLAAARDFIVGDSEAAIIEPEEGHRIIAEYQQQRNLALAGDIELIREEMA